MFDARREANEAAKKRATDAETAESLHEFRSKVLTRTVLGDPEVKQSVDMRQWDAEIAKRHATGHRIDLWAGSVGFVIGCMPLAVFLTAWSFWLSLVTSMGGAFAAILITQSWWLKRVTRRINEGFRAQGWDVEAVLARAAAARTEAAATRTAKPDGKDGLYGPPRS